jgi:hypothetical protein
MRIVGVVLLALAMSGCVPIVYGSRYEAPSRQNLADAVPASIEAGRTTMADVVLALGDPDTVAADESWLAYVSRYRKGGAGAALVLAGGGEMGLLGGAQKQMLYRRLLVRFDAAGVVQDATLDVVDCAEADFFVGQSAGSSPPCFDMDSRDLVAFDLAERLQAQGETAVVVFSYAEWWATHERGMVAVSDTAIHFVRSVDDRRAGSPGAAVALSDLTDAQLAGSTFHINPDSRRRVVLLSGDAEVGSFVVQGKNSDDPDRTSEAAELVCQRIAAARR